MKIRLEVCRCSNKYFVLRLSLILKTKCFTVFESIKESMLSVKDVGTGILGFCICGLSQSNGKKQSTVYNVTLLRYRR